MTHQISKNQWEKPVEQSVPQLRVNNSLSNEKNVFQSAQPNHISWYACGPTVYDSAHLGHARAYVTFDIIRRILQDYFGYNVFYVMNITDVDDKIILRARRNHLFAEYVASTVDLITIQQEAIAGFNDFEASHAAQILDLQKQLAATSIRRQKDELTEQIELTQKKYDNVTAQKALFDQLIQSDGSRDDVLDVVKDVISARLDSRLGSSITDLKIFHEHAAKYEKEFLEDMAMLNVREADAITRVSEYIEKIEEFVAGIIEKGFAYVSNGSVYFDVRAFAQSPGCRYAKLSPQSIGNAALINEAEGALGANGADKRSANDFALWKESKPGEPSWSSRWGAGRPGWHIECSTMASDLLGETFDIHSGGSDLKFPHHDNEIAQSEARFGCSQWVNYFMHAGHLHIHGLKMSKSLKNFITIRQALKNNTPRQIRLLFLLQAWDKPMNFSDQCLDEAVAKEQRLKEFFLSVDVEVRKSVTTPQIWTKREHDLHDILQQTQTNVHTALCDNFDFPTVLTLLFAMLSESNKYMAGNNIQCLLLKKIAKFITRMLRILGLFPDEVCGLINTTNSVSRESVLAPVMDVVAAFRDKVRALVFSKLNPTDVLQACDDLRDVILPDIGVRLEDRQDVSVWKLDDPQVMRAERVVKLREAKTRAIQKVQCKIKRCETDLNRLRNALKTPATFFVTLPPKYSAYDECFIPTLDLEGNDISAKARKKLEKIMAKHLIAHRKACTQLDEQPDLLDNLNTTIITLNAELSSMTNDIDI